jgi:hypothetical protein
LRDDANCFGECSPRDNTHSIICRYESHLSLSGFADQAFMAGGVPRASFRRRVISSASRFFRGSICVKRRLAHALLEGGARATSNRRKRYRTTALSREVQNASDLAPRGLIQFEVRSGPRQGPEHEAQPLFGRADHRDFEGARRHSSSPSIRSRMTHPGHSTAFYAVRVLALLGGNRRLLGHPDDDGDGLNRMLKVRAPGG